MMNEIYRITYTNVFKKQYAKIKNNPYFKHEEFSKVLAILSSNQVLPAKYKNHLLSPKSNRCMGMSLTKWYTFGIRKTRQRVDIVIAWYRFSFKFV